MVGEKIYDYLLSQLYLKHFYITDIGANLCDKQFQGIYFGKQKHQPDIQEVLENAFNKGIKNIILTSGNIKEFQFNINLIQQFPQYNLTTTLGFHPTQSKQYNQQTDNQILQLYQQYKQYIAFMGELGLDYDRLHFADIETQKQVLIKQLTLIAKNNIQKPLFIHSRQAQNDVLNIINEIETQYNFKFNGVFHSFTGSSQEIVTLMQKGYYISFNGLIFKQDDWKETLQNCQINKILTESDCPYCQVKRSFLKELDIQGQYLKVKGRNEPVGALDVEMVIAKFLQIDQKTFRNTVIQNLQTLLSQEQKN